MSPRTSRTSFSPPTPPPLPRPTAPPLPTIPENNFLRRKKTKRRPAVIQDSDLRKELYEASGDGDEANVKELLELGVEPSTYKDPLGYTALHLAARSGNIEIVSALIRAGAVLDAQNNDGVTALYWAAWHGESVHNEIISLLINEGADLNIQDKNGNTALHMAAERENNEAMSILIKASAELNKQNIQGLTALHNASLGQGTEVITTLINAGAELNIKDKIRGWTPLYCATERGKIKVITTLIAAGADLKTQDKDGETVLHRAASWGITKVIPTLITAGADLNQKNKAGETALEKAARSGCCEVVTLLIEEGAIVSQKHSIVNLMMQKDPTRISSALAFLSKNLEKFDILKEDDSIEKFNEEDYRKTKENLGIEQTKGKDKIMFYLVKSEEFDNKSLLEYIDSQHVRLCKQKEELIDLSVKIADLNHRDDTEGAMMEVIKNYKSCLPSGVGLRKMIAHIKEHYPWSSSKKMMMIFVSLISCLFGIGLFIFDLKTDVNFSLYMFDSRNNSSHEAEDVDDFLTKNYLIWSSLKSQKSKCYDDMNSAFKEKYNKTEETEDFDYFLSRNGFIFSSLKSLNSSCYVDMTSTIKEFDRTFKFVDDKDYINTGWFALWHCIQPFVFTLIVLLSINCNKKREVEEVADIQEVPEKSSICNLFCFLPVKLLRSLTLFLRLVPIPALTYIYRFFLDVKRYRARSNPDFRTTIVKIEKEIRDHEILGKL